MFSEVLEAELAGLLKGKVLQHALSKEARKKNSPQKILLVLCLVLVETQ